jgi:hypothetical protein
MEMYTDDFGEHKYRITLPVDTIHKLIPPMHRYPELVQKCNDVIAASEGVESVTLDLYASEAATIAYYLDFVRLSEF